MGAMARLAYGLPAAMLVLGVAAAEQAGQLPVVRWLQTLGGASYSIYLFQFIFIGTLWQVLLRTHLDQQLSNLVLFLLLSGVRFGRGVSWCRSRLKSRFSGQSVPGAAAWSRNGPDQAQLGRQSGATRSHAPTSAISSRPRGMAPQNWNQP